MGQRRNNHEVLVHVCLSGFFFHDVFHFLLLQGGVPPNTTLPNLPNLPRGRIIKGAMMQKRRLKT